MRKTAALLLSILGQGCDAGSAPTRQVELEQRLEQLEGQLEVQLASPIATDRVASFEASVCDRVFPWRPPPPRPVGLPSIEVACANHYDRLDREYPDRRDEREHSEAECVKGDATVRRREGPLAADLLRECLVVHEDPSVAFECVGNARDRARPERKWAQCMFQLSLARFGEPPAKLDEIYACYGAAETEAQYEACTEGATRISNRIDDRDLAEALVADAMFNGEQILDGIEVHGCPPAPEGRGQSGPTPPLSIQCSKYPGGRCKPTQFEARDEWYASTEWTEDPGWTHVDFELALEHHFHFELSWALDEAGACDVTVKVHGDLDADGQYSVFSRSARLTDKRLVREPWQGEEVMP